MSEVSSEAIARTVARSEIAACVARLARGEDRRDAALLSKCWWDDAAFDYGVYKGGLPEYLSWVVPGADAITNTQHVLGQSHIEFADAGRCAGGARVETHVISYHRIDTGAGERDTVIGGRYLDQFEQRVTGSGAEWRIAGRVMLYDWFSELGAAADWAQGVMGYPFTDPRFPGRAKGDWSIDFFAGKLAGKLA